MGLLELRNVPSARPQLCQEPSPSRTCGAGCRNHRLFRAVRTSKGACRRDRKHAAKLGCMLRAKRFMPFRLALRHGWSGMASGRRVWSPPRDRDSGRKPRRMGRKSPPRIAAERTGTAFTVNLGLITATMSVLLVEWTARLLGAPL
jgi:hypothetical protein